MVPVVERANVATGLEKLVGLSCTSGWLAHLRDLFTGRSGRLGRGGVFAPAGAVLKDDLDCFDRGLRMLDEANPQGTMPNGTAP